MSSTRLVQRVAEAYDPPLLIKSILAQSMLYEPDNEIIYRDLFRMNYRTFNQRVRRLANALNAIGVQAGDIVGVMEYDSHRYLELYFAVPMIGAVLHTINYRLSKDQILYTMNHAEDKFVFCHETIVPVLNQFKTELKTVEKYVWLTDTGNKLLPGPEWVGEYEDLLAGQSDQYDFPDFDENSMATLFYTTGTTGDPKGVCYTHRQLVIHTIAVTATKGSIDSPVMIHSSDVYMPLTPMFHVHAWGIPYVASMVGMKQVYPGPYEPQMLMKLILTNRVTFSHCVPTILGMLVNNPKAKELDLSYFSVIIGGSALPKGLAKSAMDLGIDIIAGYGLSETCPVLTLPYIPAKQLKKMDRDEEASERIKTGHPILFVDLKLMDDDGKFVPADGKTMGEVVVRAPWLTQTYFKEKERSDELWKHGYLHTGDIGVLEPNGTLVITDRKKDVIKSGGEWISSLALESMISSYPAVKQTAVVGIPDARWGERPLVLIVLADGQIADADSIKAHMQQFVDSGRINKWVVPDNYRFVAGIPKTSVGKIDKKRIRSMAAKGEL